MGDRILIDPPSLREAARACADAGLAVGGLGCMPGGAVPDMPGHLRARVDSLIPKLSIDLGQIQTYLGEEADALRRRADLAQRADSSVWSLAMTIADILGFDGVNALDEHFQMPSPPPPAAPKKDEGGGGIMGWVHGTLDVAGFIPGVGAIPDVVNAGIYGLEGDGENAAWSMAGAVPLAGDAAKGGKMAKNTLEQATKHADEAEDAVSATKGASRAADAIAPGGKPIGTPGSSPSIRQVKGTRDDALKLFDDLASEGTDVTPPGYPGRLVKLPDGGHVGYRETSKSGPPTIDVNVYGVGVRKIKFVP